MNNIFQRLLPPRLRARQELSGEARLKLFAAVGDQDPCLRAVIDLLEDMIEGNAAVACSVEATPEKRLRACDRLDIATQLLNQIEVERGRSKRMKDEL